MGDLETALAELWRAANDESYWTSVEARVVAVGTILDAARSGQLIPLETCNARVAAMVAEAATDCDRMAGEIADAVLTGLPEQARIREGMESAFTKAAARIRTLVTADHTAALDAMISRAREVKPLVWKEYAEQGFWRADTPIGEYSVGFDDGWWAQLEGVEFWEWETPEDPRCYSGPEAGMLACKADYTARALATLRANATDASEGER